MQPLKTLICGTYRADYLVVPYSRLAIQCLENKNVTNAKYVLPGEISVVQGNIVVIAYFNAIAEHIDEILKNANRVKKVYEVRSLKQEGINCTVNLNKTNSDLKAAGVDVVQIDFDKFPRKITVGEITEQILDYIYDDMHTFFVDTDDIKANMIRYTKEWQVSEFTSYNSMMMLTDEFKMTPAMYFVLYERNFNFHSLNPDYKRKLYSQRNIFGHNIIDIACLSSFEVWKNIRKEFDFEYKSINDNEDNKANNNYKKLAIGGAIVAGIGYSIIKKDPTALIKLGKKGLKKSPKTKPLSIINSTSSTVSGVAGAVSGTFGVADLLHKNSQYDVTVSTSNQISDLEYEFRCNRQMIIDDIERQEKSSTLLNVYKSKINLIEKMS